MQESFMKYGLSRKLNLGKYGMSYESLDLIVEDCETKEQAEQEINEWRKRIEDVFLPRLKERFKELNELPRLTTAQERERDEIKSAIIPSPF